MGSLGSNVAAFGSLGATPPPRLATAVGLTLPVPASAASTTTARSSVGPAKLWIYEFHFIYHQLLSACLAIIT